MSTNTQMHIRRIPRRRINMTKEEVVPVDQILGPGGVKLLQETLTALPKIQHELGSEAANLLDWKSHPTALDTYETTVNGFPISLVLKGSTAQIRHTRELELRRNQRPQELDPQLQKMIHRKVNHLLAVAMSRRISQKLEQYVGIKVQQQIQQKVSQRVRQQVKQQVPQSFMLRVNGYVKGR